jgi:outer membrane receptor protein involved in Fe transport
MRKRKGVSTLMVVPSFSPCSRRWLAASAIALSSGALAVMTGPAHAQSDKLDEIVVVDHLPRSPSEAVFTHVALDAQQIETAPQLHIDEILGEVPGFGLYRRSSSLVAHPTAQGASLRGIGPNGAGRALVLLDGIPQNDPFGGWVQWGRIAPAIIESADILYGGGVGAFANSALSGRIRLNTKLADAPPFFFDGSLGNKDTIDASAGLSLPVGGGSQVFARGGYTGTDGYYVLKDGDRGSVDTPVNSRLGWGEAGGRIALSDTLHATLKAAYFNEDRDNGTPLAYNGTEGWDLSASLLSYAGRDEFGWEATVFYQDRSFESQFSSVADDRNSEVPALLQFAVPGKSVGGSLTLHVPVTDAIRLQFGGDARHVEGETGENFFWSDTQFLRERHAGGEQLMLGAFGEAIWKASDQLSVTLGGRLDYWEMTDGRRLETDLETGGTLRDEHFADRDDVTVNARAAVEYRPTPIYAVRLSGYTGFRLPTINELYRPYRVRNDIIEANASLAPEKLHGGEVGFEANPLASVKGSLVFFANWVDNAVANVKLTDQPGFYAPLGVFVPEDGTAGQRLNLDRTRSLGVEMALHVALSTGWEMEARYLHVDSDVRKALVDPTLVGNKVPQVADDQATFSLIGHPVEHWRGRLDMQVESSQYDDLANSRTLDGFVTMDAYVGYEPRENMEIFARVQNLFDRDVEVAESGGLITYGQPRLFQVGLRYRM